MPPAMDVMALQLTLARSSECNTDSSDKEPYGEFFKWINHSNSRREVLLVNAVPGADSLQINEL